MNCSINYLKCFFGQVQLNISELTLWGNTKFIYYYHQCLQLLLVLLAYLEYQAKSREARVTENK